MEVTLLISVSFSTAEITTAASVKVNSGKSAGSELLNFNLKNVFLLKDAEAKTVDCYFYIT